MSHHSPEMGNYVGALTNAIASVRDPNTHTWETFASNGLPNTATCNMQQAIHQEIVTNKNSFLGQQVTDLSTASTPQWGWDVNALWSVPTPMNLARASSACVNMLVYELHNSLGQCNYTSPVMASPNQSRNYRGDVSLESQNFSAATTGSPAYAGTGVMGPTSQAGVEFMALRAFTVLRALHAAHFTYWSQPRKFTTGTYAGSSFAALTGSGADMRHSFDQLSAWNFSGTSQGNALWNPTGAAVTVGSQVVPAAATPNGSSAFLCNYMEYDQALSGAYLVFGWDYNGLPSVEMLTHLGLTGSGAYVENDIATTLTGVGIKLTATAAAAQASLFTPPASTIGGAYVMAAGSNGAAWGWKAPVIPTGV
jgi:hypothetical protein